MTAISDRLVTVATFLEPNRAHIARARLESEGIRAALDGEHHISMDWFISNAVGGVKLLVHERDRESAVRILNETFPESTLADIGDDESNGASVACPSCGSHDIYRERIKRKLVFLSILLLGFPFLFLSRNLICCGCNHKWKPSR